MKKTKIMLIIIIILILISPVISIIIVQYNNVFSAKKAETESSENEFIISSKEDNIVNIIIKRNDGIKEIKCPDGTIIKGNNKKTISIDKKVEPNKEYIFEIITSNDIIETEKFITPTAHIAITRNDMKLSLSDLKDILSDKLDNEKIATNFVNIEIGESQYVDTQETDMKDVFENWTSFGDGNWSYASSSKTIKNSKNSNYFTGYYASSEDYTDIDFSFNAMTTDSDDDMIGAMIRFNVDNSNNYTSYLFLLDRHDNGGGVLNGEYNGINRIENKNLEKAGYVSGWNLSSYITKLSVNSNLRWTRNTWQNYRLIAHGDKIEVYIDNKLIASVTDTSISSGTFGFLSLSQANTYFKDIKIYTNKEYILSEIVDKIKWNLDEINVIINLSNKSEEVLTTQDCIDAFKDNDIHYLAVTLDSNKQEVNDFLNNIDNRGKWIDSSNEDNYIDEIVGYLKSIAY